MRDATTGRIGTYQTSFTIPNLNKEEQRVPISSVVLSGQRVPLGNAVHTVDQRISAAAFNPLVHEQHTLIPSVTRVFSTGRDLYVFLQAYRRGTPSTSPLVAFVSLYRDGAQVYETPPLVGNGGVDVESQVVPLRFRIPLAGLPPGRYDCQVTVLDADGQKAVFWRAPVVLVPPESS